MWRLQFLPKSLWTKDKPFQCRQLLQQTCKLQRSNQGWEPFCWAKRCNRSSRCPWEEGPKASSCESPHRTAEHFAHSEISSFIISPYTLHCCVSTAVWNLWYLAHLKIPHKICNNIFCELTTLFNRCHFLYNIMYWEWLFPLVFLFLSMTYGHSQFVVLSLILFISYIFCMRLFLTWSPPKRISVVPHLTKHPPTLVALIGLGQWVHAIVAGSKASGL